MWYFEGVEEEIVKLSAKRRNSIRLCWEGVGFVRLCCGFAKGGARICVW